MKQKVYDFVVGYIDEHGFSPSIREICDGVGRSSTSTVWRYLWMLRGEGKLEWTDRHSRTLRVL